MVKKTPKFPIFNLFLHSKIHQKLEAKNQKSTTTLFGTILLCIFEFGWKLKEPIRFEKSWRRTDIQSGARPTNEISIEFEIRPHLAVLWFQMCSTNHN